MKNRFYAAVTAGAMVLALGAMPPAFAADAPKQPPAQTTEQQKPSEPPPAPKKAEPDEKKSESTTSGAKQAGREVSSTFKKFGKDVGDFFDGLFH